MRTPTGFTIVELLVVITIIVVLLSLLAPAMDRSIYQAELAACGAYQDSIIGGSHAYAGGNRGRYPLRHDDLNPQVSEQTIYIGITNEWFDLRQIVRGYIEPQQFVCPLSGKVDLRSTQTDTIVYGGYSYWAGWQFAGYTGMSRLGDRWGWAFNGPTESFTLLVSDRDVIGYGASQVQSTHPDEAGVLWNVQSQDANNNPWNAKLAIAMWYVGGTFRRGPIDRNFGYQDGSVTRMNRVTIDGSGWPEDERLTTVGMYNHPSANTNGSWHDIVPREGN